MSPILRNILAVIAGIVIGSVVNMGFVLLGPMLIPPPEGADLTTMEGLTAAMSLMQPKHFLFPFLAHSIGTLIGAYLAAKIGASHKMIMALIVSVFFLAGGIANLFMLPSPLWFSISDLALAYLPMGYLGGKLGLK